MANCTNCNTSIGFMNKPTFGSGKLVDGSEICSKCFMKINTIDPFLVKKIKTMTSSEVKKILSDKEGQMQSAATRLTEIKSQIENLKLDNTSLFIGRKEVNELPNILFDHEAVLAIMQGTYENRTGILVATQERVIFIDKGLLYGLKVEDFPYDKITSIQFEVGLIFGEIIIMASGNKARIKDVIKIRVKPFADLVRMKISELSKKGLEPEKTVVINNQFHLADQLEKLAKLRDNGILSEEEFQIQKSRLLA